jgi:hypothetical protein
MPRIKTDLLKEGMRVASDVRNIDNMLLIPAGCVLTERQINILQAWGVGEIEVAASESVQDDGDPLAKLPPEQVERLTAEIRGLFWQPDEANPVFQEILKLMVQRRARKGPVT